MTLPICLKQRSNFLTKLAYLVPRLWVRYSVVYCAGASECPEAAAYDLWGDGNAYLDVKGTFRDCQGSSQQVEEAYKEALQEVKWLNPFTAYLKVIGSCKSFYGLYQCFAEVGVPLLDLLKDNPKLILYDLKIDANLLLDEFNEVVNKKFKIDWENNKIVLESGTSLPFTTVTTWRGSLGMIIVALFLGVIL